MSHEHDDDDGHHDRDADLATDLSDEQQMDNLSRDSRSRGCMVLLLAIPTAALAGLLLI